MPPVTLGGFETNNENKKDACEKTITNYELNMYKVLGDITNLVNELGKHIVGEEWLETDMPPQPKSLVDNVLLNEGSCKAILRDLTVLADKIR